jgi:hypothetical protein
MVYVSDNFEDHYTISCVSNDPNLDADDQQLLREFLLSDETFDGKQYSTTIGLSSFSYSDSTQHVFLVLKTVDENYYSYFKTLLQALFSQGNPFAEPAPVFNNIENGLGILGSYSSSIVQVK